MNKNFAKIIKEVRDKAYAEGHTDGTLVVMRLTQIEESVTRRGQNESVQGVS